MVKDSSCGGLCVVCVFVGWGVDVGENMSAEIFGGRLGVGESMSAGIGVCVCLEGGRRVVGGIYHDLRRRGSLS